MKFIDFEPAWNPPRRFCFLRVAGRVGVEDSARVGLIRRKNFENTFSRVALLVGIVFLAGCGANRPAAVSTTQALNLGLTEPVYWETIDARVVPPAGWNPEPQKGSDQHKHEVWLSPTGKTAYGVIRFTLPLPLGNDLALWGFINQMRASEGDATLIEKSWDDTINATRFVAEGGVYRIRTNLFVDGFKGWAVYAGTLRKESIDEDELKLAERAREATRLGNDK